MRKEEERGGKRRCDEGKILNSNFKMIFSSIIWRSYLKEQDIFTSYQGTLKSASQNTRAKEKNVW